MANPFRPDNPFAPRTFRADNPFAPTPPKVPGRPVLSNLGRGLATGLAKTGTGLVKGIGGLTGSDRLKDFATRTEAQVEGFYDPQGTAGSIGTLGGRVVGEGATAIAGGGLVTKGISKVVPRVGAALRGLQTARSTVAPTAGRTARAVGATTAAAKRVVGTVAPILPIDAAIGAGYRPDNPFRGAAEAVGLDLAGAGVFDAVGSGIRAVKAAREVRRGAQTVDDIRRFDDAFNNPEVRTVPGGDAAEIVARGDTSFDFGKPPPQTTTPPATVDPALVKRYGKRTDEDLLDYYESLMERQAREGAVEFQERRTWSRDTGMEVPTVGQTITGRGGRAIGQAKQATNVAENVETVLRSRGIAQDVIDDRLITGQSRGLAATQEAYRAAQPLAVNRGVAGARTVGAISGAGVGGTAGLAAGDEDDTFAQRAGKVGIGVVAGAVVGSQIAKRSAQQILRHAGASASPLAADPAVQAVLASGNAPVKAASGSFGALARGLYQKVLDDVYSIRRFGRDVGGSEALSETVSLSRGWGGLAKQIVGGRAGTTLPSGMPTVRDALFAAKGVEADVIALTRAERALELDAAGMGWKASFSPAEAQATVARYADVAEVQGAADRLRSVYRGMLEMRHEAGLLTDEALQQITAKGEKYIPFVRDFGEEAPAGVGGKGLFNKNSGIRRMEEGVANAAIVNPFEQAVLDAQQTARMVMRQRVTQGVAAIVEAEPALAAPFIRKLGHAPQAVPRSARESGRVVEAVVDGKRTYYEVVDDGLHEALSGLAPSTQNLAVRIMAPFKKALQIGVTMWPDFIAGNAQRDAFFTNLAYAVPVKQALVGGVGGAAVGAALDSENRGRGALRGAGFGLGGALAAKHAGRIVGAMRSIVKNDDTFQAWMREGASGGGFYVRDLADANIVLKQLRRDGVKPTDLLIPKRWWDGVRAVSEAIEQAPRLARYQSLVKEGASAQTAAAGARDASVDFALRGSDPFVRGAGETTAFWNPKLQGMDKLVRMLRNPKTWAVGAATMTAPSVALWTINKDNPDYWGLPLYQRNLFWPIPSGKNADGRTRWLFVMKPFEPGYLFASLPERILDFAYQRDPESTLAGIMDMGGSVLEGLLPIPNAIGAPLEASIGKGGFDFFRQREIVDRGLQQLPVAERTNARTGAVASGIAAGINAFPGEALDVAPAKVQHIIGSLTGSLGRVASEDVIDPLARFGGLDTRPERPSRSFADRTRFLASDPGFNSEPIRQVYRKFDRAEERYRSWSRKAKAGDPSADAYLDAHRGELEQYLQLEGQVKILDEIRTLRREIEQDRAMSGDEKRRRLGILATAAQDAVRSGATP